MQIASNEELLVLHRALMERHYVKEVSSEELIGSPILATLHHKLLDEIVEREREDHKESEVIAWEEWRNLAPSNEIVWDVLMHRLLEPSVLNYLRSVSVSKQASYIRDVASPFRVSDSSMAHVQQSVMEAG